ncbi:hypothetical protein UlMin_018833 [Ulmus minor]
MDLFNTTTRTIHPIQVCTLYPPYTNSLGLWNKSDVKHLNFSLPVVNVKFTLPMQRFTMHVLELEMLSIFILTQLSHIFLRPLSLPIFVAELLNYFKTLFHVSTQEIIGTLTLFSYTMFIFLSGVKMDLSIVFRTSAKSFHTGALAIVASLLLGTILTKQENLQLMFVLTTYSMTSFPVIAYLLKDMKILNSDDILGVFLMAVSTLARVLDNSIGLAILDLAAVTTFTLIVIYVARPAMLWMIRQTPEGRPMKPMYISIIIMGVLMSALLSHWYHMTLVFGPMVLSLAVPDGPPLGSTLVKKFDPMVSGVLMPMFVTIGMIKANHFDLSLVSDVSKANVVLVFVIFLFSLLPPILSRIPLKDAWAIALIVSYKGVVEMVSYIIARDSKVYTFAMAVVFMTTIVVPVLVRVLYDPMRKYAGYQKRNIMHSAANFELRILTYINRPNTTPAMINLLDVSCPTKENPISLYVLHLIELIGRATPVFISHQLQKKTLSNYSYSENVILSFTHFQRENHGAAFVNVFTAISSTEYIHEDICTLALDKLTSLIILPFHRKWTLDGSIESKDPTIHSVNCSVMERSPCFVAILVDRGHMESVESVASCQASYRVAMIFLGGSDDREALTFSKRMVKDSCIKLSVIHFLVSTIASNGQKQKTHNWDKVLDHEILKEVSQGGNGDGDFLNVSYMQEMVKNGTQTATMLRSLVDDYDLFIVGRRFSLRTTHTSGLDEWSEFPELGVVGDLLASTDVFIRASVLVVKQQNSSS